MRKRAISVDLNQETCGNVTIKEISIIEQAAKHLISSRELSQLTHIDTRFFPRLICAKLFFFHVELRFD